MASEQTTKGAAILMGSPNDATKTEPATATLTEFRIGSEPHVMSAHYRATWAPA